MSRKCDICGSQFKEVTVVNKIVNVPTCDCAYEIAVATEKARQVVVNKIMSRRCLDPISIFGGSEYADVLILPVVDEKFKDGFPKSALISYESDGNAREGIVALCKKAVDEGIESLPLEVSKIPPPEVRYGQESKDPWESFVIRPDEVELLVIHGLDWLYQSENETLKERMFKLIDRRFKADLKTYASSSMPTYEIPKTWGSALSKLIISPNCVFITL